MLNRVVVFCTVVALGYAYTAIAPSESKPDKFKNEEGCYMAEFKRVVHFGERVSSEFRCAAYVCGKDGVEIFGCDPLIPAKGCKLVDNINLPYPDCCPKAECS